MDPTGFSRLGVSCRWEYESDRRTHILLPNKKGSASALPFIQSPELNKHFVLRNAGPTPPTFAAQKKFQSRRHTFHQPGKLADRRDYRLMHHVGSLLNAIHSAVEQFIGTNDLKPGPINNII